MKSNTSSILGIFLLLLAFHSPATTRYVDLRSPNATSPYTDWTTAATNIQDAIDASVDGDLVLVTNGVYATGGQVVAGSLSNRVAVTRALTVQSINGPTVTVVKGFQIPGTKNGDGAVRCVYLTNNAALIGFTLTNGATRGGAATSSERQGGGVFCRPSAVVSNCIISGNTADFSGGGASAGKLFDCIIMGNSATNGGGVVGNTLSNCTLSGNVAVFGGGANNSTLTGCTVSNNSAQYGGGSYYGTVINGGLSGNTADNQGGGAYFSTVTNCTLMANTALHGGGAYSATVYNSVLKNNTAGSQGGGACNGSLGNCALTGNTAGTGGGAYSVTARNCTLTGNGASQLGGGAAGGNFYNSVLYFNTAPPGGSDNYSVYSSFTTLRSCCTTPVLNGTGNFDADPQLADNIHLSAGSPCRGAGNPTYAIGNDFDGESWFNPPSVGCDEFHAGSATGGLTVSFKAAYTNTALGFSVNFNGLISGWASASRWEFGDGIVISNAPYTAHAWPVPGDYTVALRAYNESNPGGIAATTVVHVATEVHYVAITGTSSLAPYNSWATAATNIQDAVDAAVLPGALVLVSNGVYQTGGRVVYGALTNRLAVTKPLVVQSVNGPATTVIVGAQTAGADGALGDSSIRCVYLTNAARLIGFTLTNGATRALFSGDAATQAYGGGLWCESISAVASNCLLTGNAAYSGGGAALGRLDHCTLINNHAASQGGGGSVVALNNCAVLNNSAGDSGGGVYEGGTFYATLNNCVVANNAANLGGGAFQTTLNNCTLTGNTAFSFGGGAYGCKLYNCVAYYNAAVVGSNYDSGTLTNCCTFPLPSSGAANFTNSPLFINLAGGNLRLQSNSPCINGGNNSFVSINTDLDGRPRSVGGLVDVGAYEFQGAGMGEFIDWLGQSGLPSDGSADFTDPDTDGLNNWQEWIAGTVPTNSLSVLTLLSPSNSSPGLKVSWQSVSGKTYFLQRSTNLLAQPAFSSIQSNLPGAATATIYNDTTATNDGPYFYRIGVQ